MPFRPLHDLVLAISQLTAVPVGVSWPSSAEKPDVAGWYPLVGIALGATAWLCGAAVLWVAPGAATIASVAALIALAVATRGLHWDGLADVADAWFMPDLDRRHEVLKDSATGAFGTLAIVLVALTEFAAISILLAGGAGFVLMAAVALGRAAATFSAWLGKPARGDGLGASVIRRPGASGAFGFVAAAAVLGGLAFTSSAVAPLALVAVCAVGVASALVVPHLVSMRFSGVTGDTMGASIVVVETLVLVAGALVMNR